MSLSRQNETEFHLGQPRSCNNHLSKYSRGYRPYFWQHKKGSGILKKGTMKVLHGFFRLKFMLNAAYPQQKDRSFEQFFYK